jgi:micrococcal nuclease
VKRVPAAIISLIVLSVLPAFAADTWTGKCIGVTDGDTIKVLNGRETVKIRLHGIDCPERGQPPSAPEHVNSRQTWYSEKPSLWRA